MAQPPYGYGGYGQDPTYARDALLRGLAEREAAARGFAPQTAQRVATAPGQGAMVDTIGGIAPTAANAIGRAAGGSFVNQAVNDVARQSLGGITNVGRMGAGTAAGVGAATEFVGSLLKPKGDAPTASPYADLTDAYARRREGSGDGIAGGAVKWGGRGAQIGNVLPGVGTAIGAGVGALGGAIGGAFTKNASSAYSDFSRADAENAIREMYKTRGGREVTPQELNQILTGAGTKPGDQWVGERGLYSILSSLDANFAKEQQGLVANAGGAETPQPVYAPEDPRAGGTGNAGTASLPVTADAGATTGAGSTDATPTPALDTSKFDTDGYAPPQYVPTNVPKTAPPGFNQEKWANPNHQTPKYNVGRIIFSTGLPPKTENMDAIVAEINKSYPGTKRTGSGDVTIPGVGSFDILVGADVGGKRWHVGGGGKGKGGGKASASGGGGGGRGSQIDSIIASLGGLAGAGGNNIDSIIASLSGLSGAGGARREAMLKQLR